MELASFFEIEALSHGAFLAARSPTAFLRGLVQAPEKSKRLLR